MVLDIGEKIHVIERRRFESDVRRHFLGVVEEVSVTTVRATGFVFVYDAVSTSYRRGAEPRTRLIPLGSGGVIINVLPPETSVEAARYEDQDGRLVVSDGAAFRLDINEFGINR